MKNKKSRVINPSKNISEIRKLLNAYNDFIISFETVFWGDAEMTYENFRQGETFDLEDAIITLGHTEDQWSNRNALLAAYGRIKQLLGEKHIS